jgi:uncharacterized protein (DUF2267 family)
MSLTGLAVFDSTIQKTNSWLKDLMEELDSPDKHPDKHKAYQALRATLHALRDRLTVEEGAQFAAQLPMLIRGLYYEGWDPRGKPLRARHKEQFLAAIDHECRSSDGSSDPERGARAVFSVLAQHVSNGEIEDVKHVLPAELRELWP